MKAESETGAPEARIVALRTDRFVVCPDKRYWVVITGIVGA
jgi:hypothetical protein